MKPNAVLVAPSGFDHDRCFFSASKPLHAEALVSEPSVEAFVHSGLARLFRIDERRRDPFGRHPLEECARDELRTFVATQLSGRAVKVHETREHVDDATTANARGPRRLRETQVFTHRSPSAGLAARADTILALLNPIGANHRVTIAEKVLLRVSRRTSTMT